MPLPVRQATEGVHSARMRAWSPVVYGHGHDTEQWEALLRAPRPIAGG